MNPTALHPVSRPPLPMHQTVAGVAHDLKVPLSHIKGFVSSLRREDVDWDDETRREFLAEIEQEVDRLGHMVDALVRAQAIGPRASQHTDFASSDPAAVVNRVLQRTRDVFGARLLRVEVAPGLPRVRMDASQIERLLMNLLQNAVKYSTPGTPITVCARMQGARELELAVEDEGPGIPLEDHNRLFEPFFRNKSAAQSDVPGQGLGLAICQSIALAHGGRMAVVSRPGHTRFSVFLPLRMTAKRDRKHIVERRVA